MDTKKPKEFSLEIKGSGTKEQVILELQLLIEVIERTSMKGLHENKDVEYPNLIMKTNISEAY